MSRTNVGDVTQTFDTSLDRGEVAGWIEIAGDLVDDVEARDNTISDGRLERIERLVAQHLCAIQDPRFQSISRQTTSVDFQGETGMFFEATQYGQAALMIDPTGALQDARKEGWDVSTLDSRKLYE